MSLYFDGMIFCDLKPEIPEQVINTLQYMTRSHDYSFDNPPEHEFFEVDAWRSWLQIQPNHTCGAGMVFSNFHKTKRYGPNNTKVDYYTLSFRRCMHDDVEYYILWWAFLYWIAPHCESGFVGFCRETFTLHPTLVYFRNGKVFKYEVEGNPTGWYGELWDDELK